MKAKIKLLNLITAFTLVLLAIAAALVILGTFNEWLEWDIFGPGIEKLLYAIFFSCISLAFFGVAMSVTIAIREFIRDFHAYVRIHTHGEKVVEAPRRAYFRVVSLIILGMALVIGGCALLNHHILRGRIQLFKHLAGGQADYFQSRIVHVIGSFAAPPQNHVPKDLYDSIKALDNLDYMRVTTLYIPDPAENAAMWGFTAWRNHYSTNDGFARFYVTKDFEKAMGKALEGHPGDLYMLNQKNEFTLYTVLTNAEAVPIGILRMDANARYHFREYRLGQ